MRRTGTARWRPVRAACEHDRVSEAIAWYPWSTEAFARAHATRRPVLLVIVASWSAACRLLEQEVLADPRVARLVRDRVVPVCVDADRRPDLADRYGAGGWPTTMLLTADGDPLCGGTFVDAERLAATMTDAADRCQRDAAGIRALAIEARRARQAKEAEEARLRSDSDSHSGAAEEAEALGWIASLVLREYDAVQGGFGAGAKFPLVAPIAFALHEGQRRADADLLDVAQTTLDRMGWGGLSSHAGVEDEGAFHRMCARADWSEPDGVHLLEVQADLLRLYLDAWTLTQIDRYRDRARAVLAYVDRVLHDRAAGAFFNTPSDRVLLTDANAKMIRALLMASQVLDDGAYAEAAARAAERLVPAVYSRGAGVAHLLDTHARVRGLSSDQVHTSAALFELALVTGERTYLDLSDELLRSCLRKSWDAGRGALVDRLRSSAGAGDVGLLAEPLRPFALNCEAARLLQRLGQQTGHAEFTSRAGELRRWLAATYRTQGLMSAEYGLVLLDDAAA